MNKKKLKTILLGKKLESHEKQNNNVSLLLQRKVIRGANPLYHNEGCRELGEVAPQYRYHKKGNS